MNVVVSQPMFIPWLGLFEQIKLADIFVHYDDVQMPQGRSFMYRVQIKTPRGQQWMSMQVDKNKSGNLINDTFLKESEAWKKSHLNLLKENYKTAPFYELMMSVAGAIYSCKESNLARFNQFAIEYISEWIGLQTTFKSSSDMLVSGSGTERLLQICKKLNADTYITGHGASNYLEYNMFESQGISVEFMDYSIKPYNQLYSDFTPYVSVLDAIANVGNEAKELLTSGTKSWREYLNESH